MRQYGQLGDFTICCKIKMNNYPVKVIKSKQRTVVMGFSAQLLTWHVLVNMSWQFIALMDILWEQCWSMLHVLLLLFCYKPWPDLILKPFCTLTHGCCTLEIINKKIYIIWILKNALALESLCFCSWICVIFLDFLIFNVCALTIAILYN